MKNYKITSSVQVDVRLTIYIYILESDSISRRLFLMMVGLFIATIATGADGILQNRGYGLSHS